MIHRLKRKPLRRRLLRRRRQIESISDRIIRSDSRSNSQLLHRGNNRTGHSSDLPCASSESSSKRTRRRHRIRRNSPHHRRRRKTRNRPHAHQRLPDRIPREIVHKLRPPEPHFNLRGVHVHIHLVVWHFQKQQRGGKHRRRQNIPVRLMNRMQNQSVAHQPPVHKHINPIPIRPLYPGQRSKARHRQCSRLFPRFHLRLGDRCAKRRGNRGISTSSSSACRPKKLVNPVRKFLRRRTIHNVLRRRSQNKLLPRIRQRVMCHQRSNVSQFRRYPTSKISFAPARCKTDPPRSPSSPPAIPPASPQPACPPQTPRVSLPLPPRPASPAAAAISKQLRAAPPREIPASKLSSDRPPNAACSSHAVQTPAARRRASSRARHQSRGSCASRPSPSRSAPNSRPHPTRSPATPSPPTQASPPPPRPQSGSPPPPPISES